MSLSTFVFGSRDFFDSTTMAYYGYDYYQVQLERILNDAYDENQFAQQMVDACAEMVYTSRKLCQNNCRFGLVAKALAQHFLLKDL